MSQFALPLLFGVFVWWFGTGAVLYLVRLSGPKFQLMMGIATAALAASAWGLETSSRVMTVGGAYFAFACAILAWCWLEITFLSGLIAGPRTRPCPVGCTGWRRAGHAINAILYHEIALLAVAGGIVLLTWRGGNQVGIATFLVLWTMRLSAKLNLFLGVPILNDEFLPEQLGHLKSFFACRPMNLLFPAAVTASTVVAVLMVAHAAATTSAFETAAFLLLATLMGLAVLEHWFMVVPLPVKAMWEWSVGAWTEAPVAACGQDDVNGRRVEAEGPAKGRTGGVNQPPHADNLAPAETAGAEPFVWPAFAAIWRHP